MTREPTVEELVGETTNNDDENVGNFNMAMVGNILDDVFFDSEDED